MGSHGSDFDETRFAPCRLTVCGDTDLEGRDAVWPTPARPARDPQIGFPTNLRRKHPLVKHRAMITYLLPTLRETPAPDIVRALRHLGWSYKAAPRQAHLTAALVCITSSVRCAFGELCRMWGSAANAARRGRLSTTRTTIYSAAPPVVIFRRPCCCVMSGALAILGVRGRQGRRPLGEVVEYCLLSGGTHARHLGPLRRIPGAFHDFSRATTVAPTPQTLQASFLPTSFVAKSRSPPWLFRGASRTVLKNVATGRSFAGTSKTTHRAWLRSCIFGGLRANFCCGAAFHRLRPKSWLLWPASPSMARHRPNLTQVLPAWSDYGEPWPNLDRIGADLDRLWRSRHCPSWGHAPPDVVRFRPVQRGSLTPCSTASHLAA